MGDFRGDIREVWRGNSGTCGDGASCSVRAGGVLGSWFGHWKELSVRMRVAVLCDDVGVGMDLWRGARVRGDGLG